MRTKIAAQTVSRDDVIRMNHERCGSLQPSVQNSSCHHADQRRKPSIAPFSPTIPIKKVLFH